MKKIFKYILISGIFCLPSVSFSQSQKILYHYKGSASINTINESDNFVLTYDRAIIGRYKITGKGAYCTGIQSDAILSNSLSNVSASIINPANVTFTINPKIPVDDYYLNSIAIETSSNFNSNQIGFNRPVPGFLYL